MWGHKQQHGFHHRWRMPGHRQKQYHNKFYHFLCGLWSWHRVTVVAPFSYVKAKGSTTMFIICFGVSMEATASCAAQPFRFCRSAHSSKQQHQKYHFYAYQSRQKAASSSSSKFWGLVMWLSYTAFFPGPRPIPCVLSCQWPLVD